MSQNTLPLDPALSQIVADVRKFFAASDCSLDSVDMKQADLYGHLVSEEVVTETLTALNAFVGQPSAKLAGEITDGICDSIWVLVGLALSLDLPIEQQWAEVARANLAKIVDGKVIRNDYGKIMKPAGWTPPDTEGVIAQHWSPRHPDVSKA